MNTKSPLHNSWVWKMAWRDSRSHRRRLFLFMTSIVLGIAALVSIGTFNQNLEHAIDQQAKVLLGADLLLSSLQPFSAETEAVIDSIGGEQARETLFGSMAYFLRSNESRLVQVRAIEGEFPFYGKMETDPDAALETYKSGANILVDETLMIQFDADYGDSVQIGAKIFTIAGALTKVPSEPPIASTFNPRIYLPADYVDATNLLQRGSLVNYRVYFKFSDSRHVAEIVNTLRPHFDKYRLRYVTVENRKDRVSRTLENLFRFLGLVGFVALILGCIGVGSAVTVYVKQKLENVSILRCVGAESKETFLIYLIQVGAIALTGSALGAAFGIGIQSQLSRVFSDFLPVAIEPFFAWQAVFKGVAAGFVMSLLFALPPLLPLRTVSPLLALRVSFENGHGRVNRRLMWLLYLIIFLVVSLLAILQTKSFLFGIGFSCALVAAFGLLAGVAKLMTVSFKKFFPKSWPYIWRQGLANLYRPNNQTLVLMLAIGLGTFLIATLYLSHDTLLQKVIYVGGGNRPNLVLWDIQPDQKDEIRRLIRSYDLPILQEAPMVTMRLASLKGEPVEAILEDSTRAVNRGLLRWEFRTSYRDSLLDSETLIAGEWIGWVESEQEVIPISFEQGAAGRLNLALGDTLIWNVQGVPLTTRIASLREVDWQRIQANFFVVFPAGVLEAAPQIYVMSTKAPTTRHSAKLQRAVVQAFPNIAMVDLALVLSTLDDFLSKVSFVIRFMAFFSIFTGLIVLAAAVITSRFQRVQESVLLRTLGASRSQVMKIMVVEYAFLGGGAALTGLMLSYLGAWTLALFVFDSMFVPTFLPFLMGLAAVTGLTILIGMVNSRGILDRPPLEVLRAEVY
ncbi:MAG: ABC transporter permease [bacterium]